MSQIKLAFATGNPGWSRTQPKLVWWRLSNDMSSDSKRMFPLSKAGIHMKAVFWLSIMFLIQISGLRFRQSRIFMLIPHIYVLIRVESFLVIFRYIRR